MGVLDAPHEHASAEYSMHGVDYGDGGRVQVPANALLVPGPTIAKGSQKWATDLARPSSGRRMEDDPSQPVQGMLLNGQ